MLAMPTKCWHKCLNEKDTSKHSPPTFSLSSSSSSFTYSLCVSSYSLRHHHLRHLPQPHLSNPSLSPIKPLSPLYHQNPIKTTTIQQSPFSQCSLHLLPSQYPAFDFDFSAMPTAVATAKQCLTTEAANVLDEAVSIARSRSHAQTTSLHAVSAFLSLPSSPLREACFRARNAAFCFYSSSPRLQIRALDFALSIALDRSSTAASNQRVSDPPVSNSLMAAIKRSQANQRRQPDGFGYKQELGKEQIGTSGIKVEIRNLIVAILDDPIVSRVFSEAGFGSVDLKLAMVRPLQGFWRCNQRIRMTPELRPFKFPFSGEAFGGDDLERIVEVLVRKQGRNPLLFGVCGYDSLQGFFETVRTQNQCLPLEIRGVSVVSVEREILKFVSESFGTELMTSRFEELAAMVENCSGPGLIVCFGDLKGFVMEESDLRDDSLSCLVAKFTSFLEIYKDRVWLIGSATYEVYLKFLNRFPSVEKDWNLQPLAVTSMKLTKGDMSCKSSLMRSFVPFAGLFPPSSDFGCVSKNSYQLPISSKLCSEKPPQEAISGSKYDSIADQCQTASPSWLHMDNKIIPSNRSDTSKIPCVEAKTNVEEENMQTVKENIVSGPSKTEGHSPANDSQTLFTSSVATDLVLGTSSHSFPGAKSLFEALITRVDGQEEAIRTISQTISHTTSERGDVWMNFTGSDTIVMKKTAIALAEVISGGKDSLIHVDFTSQDGLVDRCTVFGRQIISYSDEQIREITTIDQIAVNLSKTHSSVVFLENLHLAHPPAQRSLLNAIRSGKFMDSHGREVCIGKAIFLLGSTLETATSEPGKPWPMQIVVNASSNLLNKRKLNSMDKPVKRLNKGSVTRLDLNLPADEDNEFRSNTWLEELVSQVNETVVFKPFDHSDARSKKTSTLIQDCFSKSFCSGCMLEIDPRAIDQLLAAVETEVEDWSENVLSVWFAEARKKYHNVVRHSVVNLDIFKPLCREDKEVEKAFERLPSEIILHCRPLESL